ncbi:MAG: hypothetical protein EHM20_10845 [Alphaproteobacteria bacterium]|nr:MAG: hypothetical protein EHM20_10845 [Alphaproteobacteria bacterium]
MKKYLIALSSALILCLQVFALENIPELTAKHGGIVKKTSNAFLEVVQEKERTSIYITGHDHKNITDKKLSLSAIAHVNGKKFPVQLSFENDHYSASPVNSYLHKENNYVLMLTISFSGTVDRADFNLKGK